jgi:hypothetical protein
MGPGPHAARGAGAGAACRMGPHGAHGDGPTASTGPLQGAGRWALDGHGHRLGGCAWADGA